MTKFKGINLPGVFISSYVFLNCLMNKQYENRPGLCVILVLIMDFVANNVNLRQNVDYSQLTLEHFSVDFSD